MARDIDYVTADRRDQIRDFVDGTGRLRVAERIGMPYTSLSNKLRGYCGMTETDARRMEEAARELSSSMATAQ
jgi:hypothetical protein